MGKLSFEWQMRVKSQLIRLKLKIQSIYCFCINEAKQAKQRIFRQRNFRSLSEKPIYWSKKGANRQCQYHF
ncbi:hypothetical protein FGO68_gene7149 [Halteria grandinella]|uniref:Uncharacterized protein n=1 Tax=Halteria grandinella TaxID=5974 RepID=A0A8J8T9N2_HALGN|nr:hypothetical protein FGO68_gene7149 [Halteria grandinella]